MTPPQPSGGREVEPQRSSKGGARSRPAPPGGRRFVTGYAWPCPGFPAPGLPDEPREGRATILPSLTPPAEQPRGVAGEQEGGPDPPGRSPRWVPPRAGPRAPAS